MKSKLIAGLAGCALLAASFATQAVAASYTFDLTNASRARVTSFKTLEDGEWSQNWLKVQVAPGETFEMDFGTDEGSCEVRTRIWFSDNTYVDDTIDYCDMTTITVNQSGITWE